MREVPVPSFPAANVRIMVKDVNAIWEKLHSTLGSNLKVFSPITDQYYGLRDFTILDLDGFGLRFASIIEKK